MIIKYKNDFEKANEIYLYFQYKAKAGDCVVKNFFNFVEERLGQFKTIDLEILFENYKANVNRDPFSVSDFMIEFFGNFYLSFGYSLINAIKSINNNDYAYLRFKDQLRAKQIADDLYKLLHDEEHQKKCVEDRKKAIEEYTLKHWSENK